MALTISVKQESQWKFTTFGSGGVSAGSGLAAGIAGGVIELADPSGKQVDLYYGGIGGGLAGGVKIKLGKLTIRPPKRSYTGAPKSFPATGVVLVTSSCPGDDLTRADFSGGCAFVEVGAGAIVGYSGVALLAGITGSMRWWERALGASFPPALVYFALNSARAAILMRSPNVGLQLGGGGLGYFGFIV